MIKRSAGYAGILHEVVQHNGTLYLSGLVAETLSEDIERQTEDIMNQLETLLTSNGSDMHHVLSAIVYLSDLNQKAGFNKIWQRRFATDALPARAAIGVADLGPGVLVEMVITAATKD